MTDGERVAEYLQRFAELIGVPIPPLDARGITHVARGSATVAIHVDEQKGYILFEAPLMEVPQQRQSELFRRLLELSYVATEEGAFAIDREGKVQLRALRALASLDFDEMVDLLDSVARVADAWHDRLRSEFG